MENSPNVPSIGLHIFPKEQEAVLEALKKTNPDMQCRWCLSKGKLWVRPHVNTGVIFDRQHNRHRHDRVQPIIVVECRECGHLYHFSGFKLGISHKVELQQKPKVTPK